MNRWNRRALPLLLALLLVLPCLPAPAAAAGVRTTDIRCVCGGGSVALQKVGTQTWLFLPAAADLHSLTFSFQDGLTLRAGKTEQPLTSWEPFDLTALFPQEPANGIYDLVLVRGRNTLPVKVLRSENAAALFLTSADPAKGRVWVEKDKNNKATGSAVMTDADGTVLYDGKLKQIKGRGNSTWKYDKKPYQIKLDTAADLMECDEPAKTWILLANYYDRTLLRNRITYDLAAELGLEYSPHSRPVDLYYDGAYRGSYLLSEKTEIGKNRVDIHDLEKDYEAANPDVSDFDALTRISGRTAEDCSCRYVDGLRDPENLDGGYLLELEYSSRTAQEVSWFSTPLKRSLVIKSPTYASRAALLYISGKWQLFEDAIVSGGQNPKTGEPYSAYMDRDSLARNHLILELAMDGDAYNSSTFFYKPEDEDKLYAGPVWDFDTCYGLTDQVFSTEGPVAGAMVVGRALLQIPDFQSALREESETLHTLVRDILLSWDHDAKGTILRSLAGYDEEVAASRRMDQILWPAFSRIPKTQRTTEDLRRIIDRREAWLYQEACQYQELDEYGRFRDVDRRDWFAQSVEEAVQLGLFRGVTDYLFDPQGEMTRAMVTTVLYRIAGEPQTEAEAPFSDVSPEAWYGPAVAWAAEAGLVDGYPDGTFRPEASVTREELAALLYRYAGFLGLSTFAPELPDVFADRDRVLGWAMGAVAWAVDSGLITGTPTEENVLLLDPQGNATRCQGAVLFLRFLESLEQNGSARTHEAEPQPETTDTETEQPPASRTADGAAENRWEE